MQTGSGLLVTIDEQSFLHGIDQTAQKFVRIFLLVSLHVTSNRCNMAAQMHWKY